MKYYKRRDFIRHLAAAGALSALSAPCLTGASPRAKSRARVVIVGGGFAGAACAKYIRRLDKNIDVALVEPNRRYITCPLSNLVLGGLRRLESLSFGYQALQEIYGVKLIHSAVTAVDPVKHRVILGNDHFLAYDRLVVAPGISFIWGSPAGYDKAASEIMPHAWKAGSQTTLLRKQLVAMDNGGVVGITIPPKPFRCPPGPYERASMIAHYLRSHKPRSKILLLDANETFSKQDLFTKAWKELYPGMIEWIPLSEDGGVRKVDAKSMTLYTELDEHKVAIANVVPRQAAGRIAQLAGLSDETAWCPVNPQAFESTRVGGVHVLGDAALASPLPKSASAANSQAKVCALAIAAHFRGDVPSGPSFHNTCYSLIAPEYGISVNAIYRLKNSEITPVEGSGGVSPADAPPSFRAKEASYAKGWYDSITGDTFS